MRIVKKMINSFRGNAVVSFPVYRFCTARATKDFKDILLASETWSKEKIAAWQLSKLKEIVDYAYTHVPFYHHLYEGVGYKPGNITTFADFEKLPFVTKSDIKANFADFCSDELAHVPHAIGYTSGSTGKPMCFLLDKDTGARERAMFAYYWEKYGFKTGRRCVLLRGQNVANVEKNRYYAYDRLLNYKMFDSTYINNDALLDDYIAGMNSFGAEYLQAYPSSAYTFAKKIVQQGKKAPVFKGIFLGSENVNPEQCQFIKDVFHADTVMYHYGHSECAGLALRYTNGDKLGFVPTYGYMELVENGQVIRESGISGEIVTTGFNKSMPFIRYMTEDRTALSDYQEDSFMRNFKATELIEGRKQEYLITKTKRLIPVVWLCGQHMNELERVDDFQFEQQDVGQLTVHIKMRAGIDDVQDACTSVKTAFDALFDGDMGVTVDAVPDIARNSRGKRIALIQHLNVEEYRVVNTNIE